MPEATKRRSDQATQRRRGFTLTELMVAVGVLIVVVLATGKIFGTASRVTAVGTGTADILQEAAALGRQIRLDFERLSPDGVFAIQSHRVRNDINGAVLLNPSLPADAFIRSDQLVFFTTGVQSIQTFRIGEGSNHKGQSTTGRIYYGHAYQLLEGFPFDAGGNSAHDAAPNSLPTPWFEGPVNMVDTNYASFSASPVGQIDGTQPEARQWLLARQQVVLADDDADAFTSTSKLVFMLNNSSARSLFMLDPFTGLQSPQIRDGRVDAAATQLDYIRAAVTDHDTREWLQQRNLILNRLVYFPRAERFAPSPHRADQALTDHVIASGCSSFIVEWTYGFGTGAAPGFNGFTYDLDKEAPWFGFPDAERGVFPYDDWPWGQNQGGDAANTIDPDDIEQTFTAGSGWDVYSAVFGYNRDRPLAGDGTPWPSNSEFTYTPWPAALRITMVLHDPATKLENGREFQFVIHLPRRLK